MAGLAAVSADELAALEIFKGCRADALVPLATQLRPLEAAAGKVLMRQGERAESFLLLNSGKVEITHTDGEGVPTVLELAAPLVVGEIALLRDMPRTATVVATEPLTGWVGGHSAFATMLDVPGVTDTMVRTARQRLAAFITPIPIQLRDDSWLYLRPVLPGDSERATDGTIEFSDETLYRRFQTPHTPSKSLMTYLFEVDYKDHFVWVMTEGREGPVVADARFVRDENDPTVAEVAFIVGDDYQGRGIGSFLMSALAVAARGDGVRRFTARVLADNLAMRKILERFGAQWEREDLGIVTTTIDVPPLRELSISKVLYREIHAMARQVMRAVG
ncbi:GNAT family N-acetyltransferase [Mycolicibacterium sp. 120270]|uniref:GNAT family N-acetyltransferase n=1 Tax=Mycolicibacterium sp. 120270 TaxID=3090600 RepID=UPI00299D5DF9|nr:GNAT family N-acetyltransferase [Mycolicibacterium sp. 120270]MDX1885039.1 GNAT family N-acetyltransferase [Mycolicibacterium sp. 120270]